MKNIELVNIIIKKNEKILCTKRTDIPVWEIPTGHIEKGETPKDTAIREAKEETGYDIRITKDLGTFTNTLLFKKISRQTFIAEITGGKEKLNPEVSEIRFFNPKTLPKNFVFWYKEQIQIAYNKKTMKNTQKTQRFTLCDYLSFGIKNPSLIFFLPKFLIETIFRW